jgi:hypothetical protein
MDAGKYEKYHGIALIGDRFYKGKFFPADELSKAHIDGTIHDINHMATTYDIDSFGNTRQNIEYEVGFQRGQRYDPATKKLHTDIYIKKDAPKYQAWKNHVELCKELNKIPNLSISFYFNTKQMPGKNIPSDINLSEYGYTRNSMIPYITDVDLQALSTVFKGACTDKDGCGIGMQYAVSEGMTKEQIIQKCIEETKQKNPDMSDEEIRRNCAIKINANDDERGGSTAGGGAGGRGSDDKKIEDLKNIKKRMIELEIERRKKFYMEEKKNGKNT